MHIDKDQSDQSVTSQVKSLIQNYERLRMKESEPGHPLKTIKVYKFRDTNEAIRQTYLLKRQIGFVF